MLGKKWISCIVFRLTLGLCFSLSLNFVTAPDSISPGITGTQNPSNMIRWLFMLIITKFSASALDTSAHLIGPSWTNSDGKRDRYFCTQECLYCGRAGHFIASCPVQPNSRPVILGVLVGDSSLPKSRLLLPVKLCHQHTFHPLCAFEDSSYALNLIDAEIVHHLDLPLIPLQHTLQLTCHCSKYQGF